MIFSHRKKEESGRGQMRKRNKYILLSSAGGLLAAGIGAQFVPGAAEAIQSSAPDLGGILGMRSPGARIEGKLIKTKGGKTFHEVPPPKVLGERTPAPVAIPSVAAAPPPVAVAPPAPIAAVAPLAAPAPLAMVPAAAASHLTEALLLVPLIPAGCAVLCGGSDNHHNN